MVKAIGMLEIPCTIQNFDEVFPNEEACRAFWEQQRWQLDFVCPRCFGLRGWLLAARGVMQCARKECGYQVSSTAGTLLHQTRLPVVPGCARLPTVRNTP